MAPAILVPDDERRWFAAGVDDRLIREPLQPGDDVLHSYAAFDGLADVGSHAASIVAGSCLPDDPAHRSTEQTLISVVSAIGLGWISGSR